MSARFGEGAARLGAMAARLLGWRPAEFWAATPAELRGALMPPTHAAGISRDDLNQLMEHDNG